MKLRFKNLFQSLCAAACVVVLAGCEVEAEDQPMEQGKADPGTNLVDATAAEDPAASGATTETPSTSAAPVTTSAGTNVTNEQTVVVEQIPPVLPSHLSLSKGVQEIIKLAESGVSEEVILLYIEKYESQFNLDAEEIVYLNDIGISPTIIAMMLNHDGANPELHTVLAEQVEEEPETEVATTAPEPRPAEPLAVAQQYEVSSNYVAAPGAGGTYTIQQPAPDQQQVVIQEQPIIVQQPAVTYSYFYSSLAPYGSWVYVVDYGWCWRPTVAVVNRHWRPYMHGGRWLYSDVGWYWHSDYSWGWAPFHYGRWHSSPHYGWVWTPDYTWGPSWVTWRRSGAYCGWAPLPPHSRVRPGFGFSYWGRDVGFSFGFGYSHDYYTFVPARRFFDRRLSKHILPTEHSRHIYRDSTVVNNYIIGDNNTIVNRGIGRDYLANHNRGEVPRVRVREAPETAGRMIQPDRLIKTGTETVVYRPNRPAPQLVQRHEQVMAARQEPVRPALAQADASRPAANIPSRPSRGEPIDGTIRAASGDSRPGVVQPTRDSRRGTPVGSAPVTTPTRGEPIRTDVTSRGGPPPFATPAPVRPEPEPAITPIRSSKTAAAGGIRGSAVSPDATTASGRIGSGLVTTRPAGIAPTTPAQSQAIPSRGGDGVNRGTALPAVTARGTPIPSGASQPDTVLSSRGEIARSSSVPAASPARPGIGSRLESTRPSTPALGSQPVPGAPNSTIRPSVNSQAAVSAQSGAVQWGSVNRGAPVTSGSVAGAQPQTPGLSRGSTVIQPNVPVNRGPVATPQSIPQVAPAAPTVNRGAPVTRMEVNRGPSLVSPQVQSAPPPVVRPQVVTPVQPPASYPAPVATPAPQRVAPAPAPVNRGNPISVNRGNPVSVSPAPIRGGSFPSAPPSRPSTVSPSQGRGRVEIGR